VALPEKDAVARPPSAAERVGILPGTLPGTVKRHPVEQHLASARSKLGAHSTAQMIALATRRHLITSRVA
jgi:hypothetical protein